MTPKEKANELCGKYYNRLEHTLSIEYVGFDRDIAKQCALIAVDELIEYHNDLMDVVRYELPSNIVAIIPYKYWYEVKKEIEEL